MKELFLLIKERLLLKEPLILVTVTESSGSVPRGAGARMLVGKGPDGSAARLWGSVGGGLPEFLAIEEAGRLLLGGTSASGPGSGSQSARHTPVASIKKYMLHSNEAAALGLRCGGEISVFFRSMDAGEPGLLELFEKGLTCFENGKSVARTTLALL